MKIEFEKEDMELLKNQLRSYLRVKFDKVVNCVLEKELSNKIKKYLKDENNFEQMVKDSLDRVLEKYNLTSLFFNKEKK